MKTDFGCTEELLAQIATEEVNQIEFNPEEASFRNEELSIFPIDKGKKSKSLTYSNSGLVSKAFLYLLGYPAVSLIGRLSIESEQAVIDELVAYELHQSNKLSRLPKTLKLLLVNDEPVGLIPGKLYAATNEDFFRVIRAAATEYNVDLNKGVVRQAQLGPGQFDFSTTFSNLTTEPRVGDIVTLGVRLRHSSAGYFASQVAFSAHRLVCSNGMTAPVCNEQNRRMRIRRGHEESIPKTLGRIEAACRQAFSSLSDRMKALDKLADEPMDLRRAVDQLVLNQRWSRRVSAELHAAIDRGEHGDESAFGLVNLLSYIATHNPQTTGRSITKNVLDRMDLVAGVYSAQPIHQCPECKRILRPSSN